MRNLARNPNNQPLTLSLSLLLPVDHRVMVCFFVLIGPTLGLGSAVGVIQNMYLIRVINFTLMQISLLMSVGTAIGIVGMVAGLPLLQRCMRNRPIMIMCAWFSVFQTVSFAVLSWDDLWAGMHIPRDTWMPCKRSCFCTSACTSLTMSCGYAAGQT